MTTQRQWALKESQRQWALEDLSWHWGEAYDLAVNRAGWVAKRLDNNRALVAESPDGLRELIVADYSAAPVSRGGLVSDSWFAS